MNEKIEGKEGDAPGTCSTACVFAFNSYFCFFLGWPPTPSPLPLTSPSRLHCLVTATHLLLLASLSLLNSPRPPFAHRPSRLTASLPLCLSSHCLLSSSLSRRLSSLGHTYLLSPPSASCPPIVNLCLKKCDLLLSFHVNLSALASALLAALPSPTTSHPFVIAFPLA
jgi:hypothetical protein